MAVLGVRSQPQSRVRFRDRHRGCGMFHAGVVKVLADLVRPLRSWQVTATMCRGATFSPVPAVDDLVAHAGVQPAADRHDRDALAI